MLEAAEPLPTPTGSGPVALLAGGSYGPMRVAALDAQGRVLAYGPGEGEAYALAVCPGAERVVEGVFEPTDEGPAYSIEVRDLRTMAVVAKLAPGFVWGSALPDRLRCLDPLGEEAAVFARSEVDPDRLLILSAEGARTVWRGQADAATFTAKRAFVCAGARGRNVLRVDLRTGGTATLARVPAGTGPLVVSPGGRYLAGVSYSSPFGPDAAPSRAVLVDLGVTPGRVKTAPLGGSNVFGEMLWLGPRRVVFVPTRGELDRVRVYDLSLGHGPPRRGDVRGRCDPARAAAARAQRAVRARGLAARRQPARAQHDSRARSWWRSRPSRAGTRSRPAGPSRGRPERQAPPRRSSSVSGGGANPNRSYSPWASCVWSSQRSPACGPFSTASRTSSIPRPRPRYAGST